MKDIGIKEPPYTNEDHHITASGAKKAQPARDVLEKYNIDINDPANGVFLEKGFHRKMHTDKYYTKVNKLLDEATSREDAIRTLNKIRNQLLNGTF